MPGDCSNNRDTGLDAPHAYRCSLVDAWRKGMELMRAVEFDPLPGPTLSFPLSAQRALKRDNG